jgi:hypothetical protein
MFIISLSAQTLLFPQNNLMCTEVIIVYQKAHPRAYCDVQFLRRYTVVCRLMGLVGGAYSTLCEMRNAYISFVAKPQWRRSLAGIILKEVL